MQYQLLIPQLNQYDVGIFYNEPTTFNLKHSLPNKIFEFIQARLAVAIAPSPDMASLVYKYECGVVARNFSLTEMAESLNKLDSKQIMEMKYNSNKAAQILNFQEEQKN